MKIILTFLSLIFVTTTFAFECRSIKGECRPYWNENKECYVEAQSYCDELTLTHEAKEKQKYEQREGKTAPNDLVVSASSSEPVLGSQTGSIQILPVMGGFSILGALMVGLFIFFRK